MILTFHASHFSFIYHSSIFHNMIAKMNFVNFIKLKRLDIVKNRFVTKIILYTLLFCTRKLTLFIGTSNFLLSVSYVLRDHFIFSELFILYVIVPANKTHRKISKLLENNFTVSEVSFKIYNMKESETNSMSHK